MPLWKIIIRIHTANNIMTYSQYSYRTTTPKGSMIAWDEKSRLCRKCFSFFSRFGWGSANTCFAQPPCSVAKSTRKRTRRSLQTVVETMSGKYGGKLDCSSLLLVFIPETVISSDRRLAHDNREI